MLSKFASEDYICYFLLFHFFKYKFIYFNWRLITFKIVEVQQFFHSFTSILY